MQCSYKNKQTVKLYLCSRWPQGGTCDGILDVWISCQKKMCMVITCCLLISLGSYWKTTLDKQIYSRNRILGSRACFTERFTFHHKKETYWIFNLSDSSHIYETFAGTCYSNNTVVNQNCYSFNFLSLPSAFKAKTY